MAQPPPAQQTFDPFGESAAPFQSSSFDIQSPSPFPTDPRPLPSGVGANPFAFQEPVETQAVSNSNHAGGDLLDIFGGEPQVSSTPSQEDDIFDPLAQINGTAQELPPQQQNFSSFDQPQAPVQANFSSFDQAPPQQNENLVTSVSRPKPATLSAGLLPPPPTKQSIKERNRNSNIAGMLLNFLYVKSDSSSPSNLLWQKFRLRGLSGGRLLVTTAQWLEQNAKAYSSVGVIAVFAIFS